MMAISLRNVTKVYGDDTVKTYAIKNVSFEIEEGEFVVLLGPSGSGKSTLLHMMGTLDSVSEGTILINGEDITTFHESKRTKFRREYVGFVFQQYHLLPHVSVLDNIKLASDIARNPFDLDEIITLVGLKGKEARFPHELSGGEQQRVSIARAIIKRPDILFCDEPTGALDEETGKQVLSLLKTLNETYHTTICVITHNESISRMADRIIRLNSGEMKNIEVLPRLYLIYQDSYQLLL